MTPPVTSPQSQPAATTLPEAQQLATYVAQLVEAAREAQAQLETFSQAQVDAIVRALAQVVHQNAIPLAEMAVAETRMGNAADKILKNRAKSELIWEHLRSVPSVGIVAEDAATGVVEIAEPVGVVASIVPCTNPSVTAMSNAMFALKGRNAIIIAPHPRAKNVCRETVLQMIEAARLFGLPENAIQIIGEPSPVLSQALMSACDLTLATGGPGMVKAAYSSGKPSFGVGAGNVPVVLHASADIDRAVRDIIAGKSFDNGLICASEQAVIVTEDMADAVMAAFVSHGAYVVDEHNRPALKAAMFDEQGHVRADIVGQSALRIADMAGIALPPGQERILLVPVQYVGPEYPFSTEKLSPVLAFYVRPTFAACIETAAEILNTGGRGHTAAIHAENRNAVMQFAAKMKVSRVIVNQTSATSAGGSRFNGLVPTTTLGCGTWGNNVSTDNISVRHVLNIKRVAFKQAEARDTSRVFEDS